jgi:UDP-glucuronate decarboxylase
MRTLVTGGAGFLGSHLCDYLLSRGREVLCVDNFFTGRRDNIAHLLENPYFEVIRHDITFPLHVEVDEIYNLACPASPVHYQLHPVQTTKTCVHGAINMLGLAKRLGIPILQASTSEIYGDSKVRPQAETYWGNVNPIGPRSCYDEGKRCAETLFFDYRRQYGLRIRVARIFNTYGPRMLPNDGRVVSNFIVQALSGRPLTVYGRGDQTRSFCYVTDLIEGLVQSTTTTQARSTWATRGRSPSRRWPEWSSSRPGPTSTSSMSRCPRTTLSGVNPMWAWPDGCSTGSPWCRSRRAWHGRRPTSPRRQAEGPANRVGSKCN